MASFVLVVPYALLIAPRAAASDEHTDVAPEARVADTAAQSPWSRDPFLLEAYLGVAMPVGFFGGALEYSPIENFSLSCGAGTNGVGLQTECMARARSFYRASDRSGTAGYLGVGASMGPHVQTERTNLGLLSAFMAPMNVNAHGPGDRTEFVWERAVWANFEIGVEIRGKGGAFRGLFGLAWMQNFEDGEVRPEQELVYDSAKLRDANAVMPYAGVAVGMPF